MEILKKLLSNIAHWKTTSLGLLLIGAGILLQYVLYKETITTINYFNIGLVCSGIVLILSPDSFIDALKDWVKIAMEYLKKMAL